MARREVSLGTLSRGALAVDPVTPCCRDPRHATRPVVPRPLAMPRCRARRHAAPRCRAPV